MSGLMADALGIVPIGLAGFAGMGSAVAVVVVAITTALGFGLWRFQDVVRGGSSAVVGASLASMARLEWLYRLAWGAVRGVGNGVAMLAAVLEGEGAMLWALVAGVLIWVLVQG
jgi:hypothetical protein